MTEQAPVLLTLKEVANMFDRKPNTIASWRRKGVLIPFCYILNKPLYSLESVQKLPTSERVETVKKIVQGMIKNEKTTPE